jgi:hypothetical protein
MAITPTRPGWRRPPTLRDPDPQEERHPSWLELFFDLCFVAAVAALAADGKMTAKDVARAIKTWKLDPEKPNPLGV